MTKIYLLWHVHKLNELDDDEKLIGAYSSEEKAEEAKLRAMKKPGFQDAPDGFEISPYEVDQDHWLEGFVTARWD
jgi:hypothetical protein